MNTQKAHSKKIAVGLHCFTDIPLFRRVALLCACRAFIPLFPIDIIGNSFYNTPNSDNAGQAAAFAGAACLVIPKTWRDVS